MTPPRAAPMSQTAYILADASVCPGCSSPMGVWTNPGNQWYGPNPQFSWGANQSLWFPLRCILCGAEWVQVWENIEGTGIYNFRPIGYASFKKGEPTHASPS